MLERPIVTRLIIKIMLSQTEALIFSKNFSGQLFFNTGDHWWLSTSLKHANITSGSHWKENGPSLEKTVHGECWLPDAPETEEFRLELIEKMEVLEWEKVSKEH